MSDDINLSVAIDDEAMTRMEENASANIEEDRASSSSSDEDPRKTPRYQ